MPRSTGASGRRPRRRQPVRAPVVGSSTTSLVRAFLVDRAGQKSAANGYVFVYHVLGRVVVSSIRHDTEFSWSLHCVSALVIHRMITVP